jgi:hypothetical protein
LHFDWVGVSGANQYRVNPLELVRTVALPTFPLFSVVVADVAPALVLEAAGVLPEPPAPPELGELPHAATTNAAAASPAGASHLLRIACLRSNGFVIGYLHHVAHLSFRSSGVKKLPRGS